jgi:tetratricopeptide (TPR) repeat protein
MLTFEQRTQKLLVKAIPYFLSLVALCTVLVVLFPIYWPLIRPIRSHNGRPDWEKRFRMALAYDTAGNHKSAADSYQRIISSCGQPRGYPDVFVRKTDATSLKARAYIAIGTMRSYHGRDGEALAAYREGTRLEPNDAVAQIYLGYGLTKMGETEQARSAYIRASILGHGEVKTDAEAALQSLKRE